MIVVGMVLPPLHTGLLNRSLQRTRCQLVTLEACESGRM